MKSLYVYGSDLFNGKQEPAQILNYDSYLLTHSHYMNLCANPRGFKMNGYAIKNLRWFLQQYRTIDILKFLATSLI